MASAYGLLLLPAPPSPLCYSALKVALDPPTTSALARLVVASPSSATLDITVPCPGFPSGGLARGTPAQLFQNVQKLLAGIYSLLAAIYNRDSIGEGTVDTRILLVYGDPSGNPLPNDQNMPYSLRLPSCVVELRTLAKSRRPWTHIFVVESEPGEDIYRQFRLFAAGGIYERFSPGWKTERVRGGIQCRNTGRVVGPSVGGTESRNAYSGAVALGPYNGFSFEDKLELTMAAFLAEVPSHSGGSGGSGRIIIGVTGEGSLGSGRHSQQMESWVTRQSNVTGFLLAILDFIPRSIVLPPQKAEPGHCGQVVIDTQHSCPRPSVEIVEYLDGYGLAIDDGSYALVVSGKSRAYANDVNHQRKEKTLPELDVFEVNSSVVG